MGCSACGVSCDSPCAIICYSDCSVCWVDAPAMAAKMLIDIKSGALKSGQEMKLSGSTDVRVCINGMPIERLTAFLALIYPEGRIEKRAVQAKTVTKTAAGPLDEVIEQLGFGQAAD